MFMVMAFVIDMGRIYGLVNEASRPIGGLVADFD